MTECFNDLAHIYDAQEPPNFDTYEQRVLIRRLHNELVGEPGADADHARCSR